MGKIIRVHKNKMIKATMVGEPATPGYIQLTANMVKRTANLSDLTDLAEARKNLRVASLDDLSVAATPNSIVRRDANSRFKIIDAEATNEPVSLNQLNNKQYSLSSNNITGVAPINKGGTGKTTASEAFAALGGRALGKLDSVALTDSKITGVLPLNKGGTGANNAASARATLGLGSIATLNSIGLASSTLTGTLPISKGGTGANDAASARATLGLGSIATLNSIGLASSTLTGTLPISKGGTGATTADAARTNLGLGSLATKNSLSWDELTSKPSFAPMPTESSVLTAAGVRSFRLPDTGGTYLISCGVNTPDNDYSYYVGLEVRPAGYLIDTNNNGVHVHVGYWKLA